jgi:transcriptional regulator with XRE-family HTH domain
LDVGQKLKNARQSANLTQEAVAEKIGVSRQTMSNWENNKSYPDIVSIISLSDLYSISLDELLKGDEKMIKFLEKSTKVAAARQKLIKLIPILAYLLIWLFCILIFWVLLAMDEMDGIGYTLLVIYFSLPISTLLVSVFIGKDDSWANTKWLMLLFFGVMFMLLPYLTYTLAGMITFNKLGFPDPGVMLPGIIFSAIGVTTGVLVKEFGTRRKKKQAQ